jgi:hypothetical protein
MGLVFGDLWMRYRIEIPPPLLDPTFRLVLDPIDSSILFLQTEEDFLGSI